jgi:hypothetical protein
VPGWTFAEIHRDRIAHVRADGVVLNATHWTEQAARVGSVTSCRLG